MPSVKKKPSIKNNPIKSTAKFVAKKAANSANVKKNITSASIAKTRPTQHELHTATKKVMKQYSIAIKNLARR